MLHRIAEGTTTVTDVVRFWLYMFSAFLLGTSAGLVLAIALR